MADNGGFIDLRIGHGAQGVGDDSVWPSFTDIMTVVVMIFLMALVVIMVRNFELDRELLATISDRQAAQSRSEGLAEDKTRLEGELAEQESILDQTLASLQLTEAERDDLEQRLRTELGRIAELSNDQERLQAELSAIIELRKELEQTNQALVADRESQRQEIDRLLVNNQTLTARIAALSERLSQLELESSEEIASLTTEKQTLGEKLDTVSGQLTQIRLLLDDAELENRDLLAEIENLTIQIGQAEQNYAIAEEEIQALKTLIQLREAENAALQAEASTTLANFRSLQEEYDSLDEEYRKLIRPARSEAGKFVVEVRVLKEGAALRYQIRLPEDAAPRDLTLAALHQELADLKATKGQLLYTKIVIPETSNLSHNEAWEFTQTILNRYDYYHQPQ